MTHNILCEKYKMYSGYVESEYEI